VKQTFLLAVLVELFAGGQSSLAKPKAGNDLFTNGTVSRLRIEIPTQSLITLAQYQQVWRQPRPTRVDVSVTVREGEAVYTNVAIHLKGSFSFQPIYGKPSLTLNFDKFSPGQRFHGLTKIHLNNSIQDPSYLCEQFARDLFNSLGVPAPRATPALVSLNGRDLGVFVLIEGANKQFVKRNFASAEGNLYDGGAGGEVTSALKVDSGENPNDRSDLKRLVQAARETNMVERLARLEQLMDVERFINFAATEAFIVHWDGYCIGENNYRVFHDVTRDKMVFIPHGLDQLFGVSSSISSSITPPFRGLVAKALFAIPEARRRYLHRLQELTGNEFTVEALQGRFERLATPLRAALAQEPQALAEFEQYLRLVKSRIAQRSASVQEQLKHPRLPLQFSGENPVRLASSTFKSGATSVATGARRVQENRETLVITGTSGVGGGAWRNVALLEPGHYEFTGNARTEGLTSSGTKATNGAILRVSGERSLKGITISDQWKPLRYEFDVHGIEDVELVCELRGRGTAFFDTSSLRIARKGPIASE
jgi:hypothetical protein